jgi:hypothetical protein
MNEWLQEVDDQTRISQKVAIMNKHFSQRRPKIDNAAVQRTGIERTTASVPSAPSRKGQAPWRRCSA